ncbi:MAG: transposase [Desulfobacterales bacterium]|nr:transposase [Desulfobacterales bacterium]
MSNYRRAKTGGGTFFFNIVSYRRQKILCDNVLREALRTAIKEVQKAKPFIIDAWILLPDHLHCMWTLPKGDSNYGVRAMIKRNVTKSCGKGYYNNEYMTQSKINRKESTIWQRRYWEHQIRDQDDYNNHIDYIHYNPVKQKLVKNVKDWEYSTFHRFVKSDIYRGDWGGIVKISNIDFCE